LTKSILAYIMIKVRNWETVMSVKKLLIVCVAAVSLSACLNNSGPKGQMGGLLGAGGGALLGSQVKGKAQIPAIVAGTILGGVLGNSIGNSLDKVDQMTMAKTTQRTLEVVRDGETNTWRNPNTGNSGTVVPTRTYQSNNTYCREFQQTVVVGGQQQSAYGTACRQPDGTWKIQG